MKYDTILPFLKVKICYTKTGVTNIKGANMNIVIYSENGSSDLANYIKLDDVLVELIK